VNLLIISHKEIWGDPASSSGYATVGGFPFQIAALCELFDRTVLVAALRPGQPPAGARPLSGHHLTVRPLPEPPGTDLRRKLALLAWLPRHLPHIWRTIRNADAIHTPIPGDLGLIGLLLALLQRKPLFVRHCGTWGNRTTLADRFIDWLLPRIAGGRNVVLATGGAETPPCSRNPNIHWIFSTTLRQRDLPALPRARPWQPGETLRLVTVSRLTPGKNTLAALRALPAILQAHPAAHLHVVGDGPTRPALQAAAGEIGIREHLTFHGNRPHREVLRLLARSHLFLFPTRVKEGFPKAVLEALACGLPVVAARVSVLPRLLAGCGITLSDTGPQAVAAAVLALTADPERMARMAANARRTAHAYTLEAWQQRIAARLEAAWGPLYRNPQRAGAKPCKS